MVTLNRIYTRTGDQGFTGLVGGARISKTAPRVWAYGDVDELNAHLGICRTLASEQGGLKSLIGRLQALILRRRCSNPVSHSSSLGTKLAVIQNELFDLGSELATPPGGDWVGMPKTTPEQISKLEEWIDEFNAHLPDLKSFVLPGGNRLNAQFHIARTVCRRAERSVLALKHHEEVSDLVVVYLNRLSDLLFVMSRYAALEAGVTEYLWVPGSSRSNEQK
jgi:cob(I)alamin adenosyltransferase